MNTKFMLLALVAVTLASSSMAAFVDVTTATGCPNYQFGYGSDCSCAVASNGLTVDNPLSLTFDAAGKAVTSDVTRFSADTVYIRYSSSLKYVNHTRAFKDGDNSACLAAFTWKTQKDDTAATCSDVSYLGSAPWTNALATNCGFDRKIEGTKVVYTIDFRVTVNEVIPFTSNGLPTGACRGSCTTVRTITYKLPFVFKFETEVTVTSSNIDVFAPVLVVSALTSQEVLGNFPTDLPTLRTVLQTSVQWPFQIKTLGSSDASVADKSKLTLSRSDLTVSDYTVGLAGCPTTDNSLCVQTWTMNVAHANVSNANNCDFDGSYSMDFNIFCRGSRASSCPLAGEALTGSGSLAVGSVSFSLATGNACSQVAEQIVLDTWIQSFISAAARATATGAKPAAASAGQKDDFLDGQTIYFRVAVKTSEAAIDYTVIKNLNIYRTVDGVASSQSLITNFVKTSFGTSLGLVRNVGTAASAGQWSFVDFSVVVSTSVLGFTQDQIFTYMFVVNVAVQYVNGGQPDVRTLLAVDADGFQTFTFVGSFNEEAVATTGSDLVKGVVVSGSGATPAATSSSSSNSATTSGLIAGLSAFVALVAVVAGVMVVSANRRAAAAKAQFERTQSSAGLTGVSTDANSAHMSMADLSVQQVKVSYDAIDE